MTTICDGHHTLLRKLVADASTLFGIHGKPLSPLSWHPLKSTLKIPSSSFQVSRDPISAEEATAGSQDPGPRLAAQTPLATAKRPSHFPVLSLRRLREDWMVNGGFHPRRRRRLRRRQQSSPLARHLRQKRARASAVGPAEALVKAP
jgi:hypothetical protein